MLTHSPHVARDNTTTNVKYDTSTEVEVAGNKTEVHYDPSTEVVVISNKTKKAADTGKSLADIIWQGVPGEKEDSFY